MTFETCAGLRLGFTEEGHGAPVLLLHPFPLNSQAWAAQAAALAPEQRILAVDFPGFGLSGAAPSGLTLGQVAQGIVELARFRGHERLALVGISMGGYLALEIARQAPELLSRLVLADSRASADSAQGAAARERFAIRVERQGIGWVADELLPSLLGPRPRPEVVRQLTRLINQATPNGVAAAQRAMATRPDQRATLEGLAIPALILVGALDALTPPKDAREMAERLPGARLELIPGAGHLSFLEEPETFSRALISFLAG